MSNTNPQYVEILERLTRIERILLQAIPPSRRTNATYSRSVVAVEPSKRMSTMLKQFNLLTSQKRVDRLNQKFNRIIVPAPTDTREEWRLVHRSILLNRCSQRKCYCPAGPGDDDSALVNAERTLLALLTTKTLAETTLGHIAENLGLDLSLRGNPLTPIIYDPTRLPAQFAFLLPVVPVKRVVLPVPVNDDDDDTVEVDDTPEIADIEADDLVEEPPVKKNGWTITE